MEVWGSGAVLCVLGRKRKLFFMEENMLTVFDVPLQINGLTHVNIPVMLMPDDFKAFTKIKIDHHFFNK